VRAVHIAAPAVLGRDNLVQQDAPNKRDLGDFHGILDAPDIPGAAQAQQGAPVEAGLPVPDAQVPAECELQGGAP